MSKLRSNKNGVSLQSRRMFLRSAGGHTLSIPFLTSLLTLKAEKAYAALPFPARFVSLVSQHGGLTPSNWLGPRLPTTVTQLSPGISARVDNTTSLLQNGALSPVFDSSFSSLFPQLSLIHGADFLAYHGHNGVIPLGANPKGTNSSGASDQNPDWTSVIGENPSIDHVLAFSNNSLYGAAAQPVRRLLNIGDYRTYSWGRARYYSNDPVYRWDYIASNQGVFTTLFGGLSSGGTTTNPITNLINEFWPSGRALMSSLTPADRSLLEQLFQLASDTVSSQGSGGATCSSTAPQGLNNPYPTPASCRLLADIIAMAFKCDLTRVVSVALEHDDIPGYHDIVHNFNGNTVIRDERDPNIIISSTPNQPVVLTESKKMATNFVARLGNNLNVQDPVAAGSTILNNSLIYWSFENTVPHDNFSQPIMLLGSAGGRIKSGLVADLSRSNSPVSFYGENAMFNNGDLLNRLWTSLFYAFNVPKSEYETQRGGNNTVSLNTGFGHVWPRKDFAAGSINRYTTHLARIGEPWEFLTKSTTNWG